MNEKMIKRRLQVAGCKPQTSDTYFQLILCEHQESEEWVDFGMY